MAGRSAAACSPGSGHLLLRKVHLPCDAQGRVHIAPLLACLAEVTDTPQMGRNSTFTYSELPGLVNKLVSTVPREVQQAARHRLTQHLASAIADDVYGYLVADKGPHHCKRLRNGPTESKLQADRGKHAKVARPCAKSCDQAAEQRQAVRAADSKHMAAGNSDWAAAQLPATVWLQSWSQPGCMVCGATISLMRCQSCKCTAWCSEHADLVAGQHSCSSMCAYMAMQRYAASRHDFCM